LSFVKSTSKHNSLTIGIVALVNAPVINGLSQYIIHLYRALKREFADQTFKLITNKEFSSFFSNYLDQEDLILVDIPHHPRWIMRPFYFFWQNYFGGEFLKDHGIDVLHIPNAIPLLKIPVIPTVVTIHDMAEFRGYRHSFLHNKFRKWVTRLSAVTADHILTVSDFSRKEIFHFLDIEESKVSVSYPGNPLTDDRYETEKEIPVKNEFLFLAGGGSNKNQQNVIHAFLKFNKRNKFKLNVITNSEKLCNDPNIHWYQHVDEEKLIRLYQRSVALLYPSLYEGFGFPILEAMSLGVPVITSNRASMPEVVQDAGILIDPENQEQLINAMIDMVKNERERTELIRKGSQRVCKFTWADTAHKTMRAYEKVVEMQR